MMGSWWVASVLDGPNGVVVLVSWTVVVIGSIVLHELGHGWAAIRRGDRTPIETGHMTWNPVIHMGHMSLLLFLFFGFAFGAMPVNPSRFRGRYASAYVAAAGPAMNLLLALACIILGGLVAAFAPRIGDPLAPNLLTFFSLGSMINIVLMLFNLLPIPPLDGSRILANFSPEYNNLWKSENAQWVAMGLLILAIVFGGDSIVPVAMEYSAKGIGLVAGLFK